MLNATTVTVGSGKAIHWGTDCGTMCGAAHRSGFFTAPKLVKADAVTCKRCVKAMAARVEADHAEAIELNATYVCEACGDRVPVLEQPSHNDAHQAAPASVDVQASTQWIAADNSPAVQVTSVASFPSPRVSFRRADGNTGTLLLGWFLSLYTQAPGVEQANAEALEVEVQREAAKRETYRQAVAAEFVESDPEDADGAVKLLAMLAAPASNGEVPNTAEAWKAYAERVKASRDAAERELARLLRDMATLAGQWEHAADQGQTIHRPWSGLRVLAAGVGR